MDFSFFELLQLNDATFPIGSYAFSWGLETFVQQGIIHDSKSAEAFILSELNGSFLYSDLLAVRLAWEACGVGSAGETHSACGVGSAGETHFASGVCSAGETHSASGVGKAGEMHCASGVGKASETHGACGVGSASEMHFASGVCNARETHSASCVGNASTVCNTPETNNASLVRTVPSWQKLRALDEIYGASRGPFELREGSRKLATRFEKTTDAFCKKTTSDGMQNADFSDKAKETHDVNSAGKASETNSANCTGDASELNSANCTGIASETNSASCVGTASEMRSASCLCTAGEAHSANNAGKANEAQSANIMGATNEYQCVYFPVAYGAHCAARGIPETECLAAFIYSQMSARVTTCVKLVPLSQTEGQQILYSVMKSFSALTEKCLSLGENDFCRSCPGLDVRAMQHEYLYSRLYSN